MDNPGPSSHASEAMDILDKEFRLPLPAEMTTQNNYEHEGQGARPKNPQGYNTNQAAGDTNMENTHQIQNLRNMVGGIREEMQDFMGTMRGMIQDLGERPQRPNHDRENVTENPGQARGHARPLRRQRSFSYSSDEAEVSQHSNSTRADHHTTQHKGYSRLPPFTGREKWEVWYNRFQEVATLRQWDDHHKLDELLPKLQGPAGEFVYSQLSHRVRTNYPTLIQELNSRFRVVETRKTFGAKFSNRVQKNGETVEEYAADLKRLYDKSHADRDLRTREEDLLRRFLDGLQDDRARFHIEYIKEPENIDQAVYEAVNFQETRR